MLALLLAAAQPAASPPPPRTTILSAVSWQCRIRDQAGQVYDVRGTFDAFPPDRIGGPLPKGRIVEDRSGTFVAGEYHAGLLNRSSRSRLYALAVAGRPPAQGGRNFYHFMFRLYPDQPGVVMIEQQLIDLPRETYRGFGAGTCRSQFGADPGRSR
jgi:hypothetical protein